MKVAVYCRVCTNLLISSSIISPAHFDDDIVSSDGFMILHGYKIRHNWLIYFLNEYCFTLRIIERVAIVWMLKKITPKTTRVHRNLSTYNILRWVAWTMGQTNCPPRVWYSKYYFFIYIFYRHWALKTLYSYFCNSIKIRKMIERILGKNFAKYHEKK